MELGSGMHLRHVDGIVHELRRRSCGAEVPRRGRRVEQMQRRHLQPSRVDHAVRSGRGAADVGQRTYHSRSGGCPAVRRARRAPRPTEPPGGGGAGCTAPRTSAPGGEATTLTLDLIGTIMSSGSWCIGGPAGVTGCPAARDEVPLAATASASAGRSHARPDARRRPPSANIASPVDRRPPTRATTMHQLPRRVTHALVSQVD